MSLELDHFVYSIPTENMQKSKWLVKMSEKNLNNVLNESLVDLKLAVSREYLKNSYVFWNHKW